MEAADFAQEYIRAVMGRGKEYFGLEHSCLTTAPSTWLPFQTLDLLLLELKEASEEDGEYKQVRMGMAPCTGFIILLRFIK
jgi:nuclear pore complex protein Nup160